MVFDILQYNKLLADNNISMIYSGPMWAENLEGIAEILRRRLDLESMPMSASQSVFSVFVEQMNNMMMYSAEKVTLEKPDKGAIQVAKGIFVLGMRDKTYFIQSGNMICNKHIDMLKSRIDYLNTLDKKELRRFYKEKLKEDNDNAASKGAGIGLIEIAKRASAKIEYAFIPQDDEKSYFTLCVMI